MPTHPSGRQGRPETGGHHGHERRRPPGLGAEGRAASWLPLRPWYVLPRRSDAPVGRHGGRPGAGRAADLPPGVAGQRPGRRPGGDHAARSPGHGVRRAGRAAADHRALHDRARPARLRGVRPVPGPGAGPGLVPRADDRRHPAAAGRGRRRPRAGRGLRLGAGVDGRRHHGAGRGVPARVRGGPALPADADRLHERAGPHHPGGAAAQAVRLLGGCRHPAGRDGRLRGAARGRCDARRPPSRWGSGASR